MRRRRSGSKISRSAFALLALAAASVRGSEITSTWSGNTGDWTDATQWSTNPNYPNNGTPTGVEYDTLINAPGAGSYTVSLSTSITTDSVTLNSPNATLLQTGGTLTTGTLNISSGTYSLSGGQANFANYNNTGGTFSVFASSGVAMQDFTIGSNGFSNAGGIIESGANSAIHFDLMGNVATAQLGNIVAGTGGFISIAGASNLPTIDNTGTTLTFGASIGGINITDVTVNNGAINFPSNTSLTARGFSQRIPTYPLESFLPGR